MTSMRVLFIGGLTSYRALFAWLTPAIAIPTFLFAPLAQILLFVYFGRVAGVENDSFYLVGNALLYAAIPCLFAMGNTMQQERTLQTLPLLLATPARRFALFLGRALPVIVNGFLVSVFALVVGALMLGVHLPLGAMPALLLAIAAGAYSCTGFGLLAGAIGLRVRETAVLTNVIYGLLLLFCGVNVPIHRLPGWMAAVSPWLPLSHAIAAARVLIGGGAVPLASPRPGGRGGVGVSPDRAGGPAGAGDREPPARHPGHTLTPRLSLGETLTQVPVSVLRAQWTPKTVATRNPPAGTRQEWRYDIALTADAEPFHVFGLLASPSELRFARRRRSRAATESDAHISFLPSSWRTSDSVRISLEYQDLTVADAALKQDPRAVFSVDVVSGSQLSTGSVWQIGSLAQWGMWFGVGLIAKRDTEATHGRWRLPRDCHDLLPDGYRFLLTGRDAGRAHVNRALPGPS